MEKISVVLATYNGSEFLKKQVDSILNQDYPIDEIVVMDDNSTDNTKEILQNYSEQFPGKFNIHHNEKRLGPTENFRVGASFCKNDFVAFADQDDIWLNEKISAQVKEIKWMEAKFPNLPLVVFHDLTLIDRDEQILDTSFWNYRKFKPNAIGFKEILAGNVITGCTVLMNRKMLDEFVKMSSDKVILHDYWIALLGYGLFKYSALEKPLMLYRNHGNSVTDKKKGNIIDWLGSQMKEILNQNKQFLKVNIEQAKEFKTKYYDKLSEKNKVALDNFINIESKGVLARKLWMKKNLLR